MIYMCLSNNPSSGDIDSSTLSPFLLICYVMTGSDTVSYPHRYGKRNAAHCAFKMVCCLSEFGREYWNGF